MTRRCSLALALLLTFAACRPTEPAGGGSGQAPPPDPLGTSVTAELVGSLRDGDARIQVQAQHFGAPALDAEVVVTGDMFHAGMAPVIAEAAPQGDGRYLTPPLDFTMAGDWILTIDITFADGFEARETLLLTVPRP